MRKPGAGALPGYYRTVRVSPTSLPDVLLIEPAVFADDRGYFLETYHAARFREAGIDFDFVQDNQSRSYRGVLRGLHYQEPNAQGKLVRCSLGRLWDVAVDVRAGSPHFGKWFGTELNDENQRMLWIPPGFAHGFCALSDTADLAYKCTALYDAPSDRGIAWDDPDIGIEWPISSPSLSPKDARAPRLKDALVLPRF
jgi:dTDP-4-dehydrorhamnose 3,5-epimerase